MNRGKIDWSLLETCEGGCGECVLCTDTPTVGPKELVGRPIKNTDIVNYLSDKYGIEVTRQAVWLAKSKHMELV